MRTITYAINKNTGLVWSRIGSETAFPVLDYNGMTPKNNFETHYNLEKANVLSVGCEWDYLHWTKKIPEKIKNKHRKFWGFPELKKPSLKLFVWEGFSSDYTDGLAFAVAKDETEARKMILKERGFPVMEWGDLKIYPLTKKIAKYVSGGG